MAVKNSKTGANRQARAKSKTGAKPKASARKASAKQTKAKSAKPKPASAKRAKAAAPKRKPARKRTPVVRASQVSHEAMSSEQTGEHAPAKKRGALARLKTGVGSLFARMTGRGAKSASGHEESPNDRTIELAAADIEFERSADDPSGSPPPPPRSPRDE